MRDDFLNRDWAENHDTMTTGIDKLIAKISAVFIGFAARRAAHDLKPIAPKSSCQQKVA